MDNSNIQDQLRHLQSASEPPFSGFPPRAPHELRASPFEGRRLGYSADAEVGRPASGDMYDRYDQTFSGRQSLGSGQPRVGHHRRTLSLPANSHPLPAGRNLDLPRSSFPVSRRSHSLQQMRERLSIAIHRGSVDPWSQLDQSATKDVAGQEARRIRLGPNALNEGYKGNSIRTSKYNIITFLPFFLYFMFSRVAYLYFLTQAALAWWSTVSPFSPYGPTIALVFVLLVAAGKAIIEDKKRHREDRITNNSTAHVVQPDGSTADVKWSEVHVGMVLEVRDNENIPADLLCLHCSHGDNVCFIKTVNLDGESNLKIRRPVDIQADIPSSAVEAKKLLGILSCEPPNSDLHNFVGNFAYQPQAGGGPRTVPVTMNEVLLRGTTIKNSGAVHGLVIYTGPESRIQMNAARPPKKTGAFDSFLNIQITLVLLAQLTICLAFAVGSYAWRQTKGYNHYYLGMDHYSNGNYQNGFVYVIILFITFWILFSYLVPISLFVTIEIIKFVLCSVYIAFDPHMREGPKGEGARARNSDIVEDLGMVEYVFSDKTGTLTSNEMQLRMLAIMATPFGDSDYRMEDAEHKDAQLALRAFNNCLAAGIEALKDSGRWKSILEAGGSPKEMLGRPSPHVQARQADSDIAHASSSPLAAQGSAAQQSGAFSESQPLMNGQATSMSHSEPEAASKHCLQPGRQDHPNGSSNGALDRNHGGLDSGGLSSRDAEFLGQQTLDFWLNLCICHTLIVEQDKNGGLPVYQGPSPDEVALVEGGRQLGFEFVARDRTTITVSMLGDEASYEVLNVLDFTSERARMSIIVRAPDGTIRLLCKGSDSALLARLKPSTDQGILDQTHTNLHDFSVKGLRTLVLATRVLDEQEYQQWAGNYEQAASSLDDREQRIAAVSEKIERDLELVGVTAIEDKLQAGVPEAINKLITAGIKVWMITGDKQETAINIAIACKLVHHIKDLLIVNAHESEEAAKARLQELLALCRTSGATAEGGCAIKGHSPEMVVDGRTLSRILGTEHEPLLAQLAYACSGVVVCRASPSQKATIVRMMKRFQTAQLSGTLKHGPHKGQKRGRIPRWLLLPTTVLRKVSNSRKSMSKRMLAVGDGANDVAMIQAADIGVGIMGKEGRQAVNNSDFAFSQFRFLVRLLLVHGTLADYRLGRLIKYSFYKNITFAFIFLFFQPFNGVSGQALLDGVTAAFYNAFFTAGPICAFALFDRPVRNLDTLMDFPQHYNRRPALTTRVFWKTGILWAITHAVVIFFVPFLSIVTDAQNATSDVWGLGKVMFIGIIGVVSWEIALISRFWTWIFIVVWALSYAVTFPFLIALAALFQALKVYDSSQIGVAIKAFAQPNFWVELILIYIVTFSARFLERSLRWLFAPNDSMLLFEIEAVREREQKGAKQAAAAQHASVPQEMKPLPKSSGSSVHDTPPIC